MSELHELAERMGVETHITDLVTIPTQPFNRRIKRFDLEIAHDLLPKLLATDYNWRYEVCTMNGVNWHLIEARDSNRQILFTGHYIECVCELASRHIKEKI